MRRGHVELQLIARFGLATILALAVAIGQVDPFGVAALTWAIDAFTRPRSIDATSRD
jgi:hypothetical protein